MSITYVGIDVSARELEVATDNKRLKPRSFENTATGVGKLCTWLGARAGEHRVVLEPTGLYSLDVALALTKIESVAVAVPNPRAVRSFAKASMVRNKNDATDASVLVAFGQRMEWVPWSPPSLVALQVRSLSRAIMAFARDTARVKQRLHSASATTTSPKSLIKQLKAAIVNLQTHQVELRKAAVALIDTDPQLKARYQCLLTLPGVAMGHAITFVGELSVLAPSMTARQWTAHAGLDPVTYSSGTSVKRRPHISRRGNKYLRQALYLASLVAFRVSTDVGRVHQRLIARGKAPKQAHCAVMRKYLHVMHSMWRSSAPWDGTKFGNQPKQPLLGPMDPETQAQQQKAA